MNEKGFSLNIIGAEAYRPSISRNNLIPFLVVVAIGLVVAAIVFLPLPSSTDGSSGPAVGSADVARWEAMGEYFQATSMDNAEFEGRLIDGWNRHADYYESSATSAERPLIDGWNKHADYYESASPAVDALEKAAIDSRSKLVEYYQSHGR